MSKKNRASKTAEVLKISNHNTAVVVVRKRQAHKVYKKVYEVSSKLLCHFDKKPELKSFVSIISCRPVSKNKRWRIIPSKNEVSK